MEQSKEREAFEAWAKKEGYDLDCRLDTVGNYKDSDAYFGFQCYLAGAALTPPRQMVADSAGGAEPVAWLHRQGDHSEVSERQLDEGEISRGWTQEPLYAAPAPSASPAALNPTCGVFEDMLTSLEYTEAVYRLNVVKDSGEPSSTLDNLQRVIARAKGASPAALTVKQSGFSCAKRAADPQNEFASCRQWCGDSQRCMTGFDTAKFFRHVDTILSMSMEQREQSTFGARDATPELMAAIRAVNEIEGKTRLAAQPPAAAEAEKREIRRFDMDMDGSMDEFPDGRWVRYEDHCAAMSASKEGENNA